MNKASMNIFCLSVCRHVLHFSWVRTFSEEWLNYGKYMFDL